jgi:hypothetical protein
MPTSSTGSTGSTRPPCARWAAIKSPESCVNDPGNLVHWNRLKGVPRGIGDGIDADTLGSDSWIAVDAQTADHPPSPA